MALRLSSSSPFLFMLPFVFHRKCTLFSLLLYSHQAFDEWNDCNKFTIWTRKCLCWALPTSGGYAASKGRVKNPGACFLFHFSQLWFRQFAFLSVLFWGEVQFSCGKTIRRSWQNSSASLACGVVKGGRPKFKATMRVFCIFLEDVQGFSWMGQYFSETIFWWWIWTQTTKTGNKLRNCSTSAERGENQIVISISPAGLGPLRHLHVPLVHKRPSRPHSVCRSMFALPVCPPSSPVPRPRVVHWLLRVPCPLPAGPTKQIGRLGAPPGGWASSGWLFLKSAKGVYFVIRASGSEAEC